MLNSRLTEAFNLSGNLLTSTFPPAYGDLSKLTTLDLSKNQLTGTIPNQLSNLTDLQSLDLDNNNLSGSIPGQLGALSNLGTYHELENFKSCWFLISIVS